MRLRSLSFFVAAPLLSSCSGLLPSTAPKGPSTTGPQDPTPLSKCHVAASSTSPLVTEWPASEKAHLQSLMASQMVAVEYSGCELRVIDGCTLPGKYVWTRTTLATDTVEIANADELYAKLPIGAVGLEGELERSGRLAVKTSVSGQLRSEGAPVAAPPQAGCAQATHYISAVSVGAFELLSGSDTSAGGGVGIAGVGGGTKASRREMVLREAGSRTACTESTDEAPNTQCASPIQVFLSPLKAPTESPRAEERSLEQQMRSTGVFISFPRSRDEDEMWTLRAPGGRTVCTVPCGAWVGPVSGYFLQREPRNGYSAAVLHLPQSFPHPVGSRVTAEYQAERGSPTLSRLGFYGAIPIGIGGAALTAWGIVQATKSCPNEPGGCFPPAGFLIGTGVLWLAMSGGLTWWYLYSRDERFTTYEESSSGATSGVRVMLGPGGVSGIF